MCLTTSAPSMPPAGNPLKSKGFFDQALAAITEGGRGECPAMVGPRH